MTSHALPPLMQPRHLLTALLTAALGLALWIGACAMLTEPVRGQEGNCSTSTPAVSAPGPLWGALHPGDAGQQLPAERDATRYTGNTNPSSATPLYSSLDVENGWIFATYAGGLRIFDARGANAERPRMVTDATLRSGGSGCNPGGFWILAPGCSEIKQFLWDIDAPAGRDDIVAVAGNHDGTGMSIIDTTSKAPPRLLYQDTGKGGSPQGSEVYADTIGNRDYAFLAANGGRNQGVFLYDMTAARALGRCGENTDEAIACAGVFKGRIGPAVPAVYLDGVVTSAGSHLLAVSGGGFSPSDRGIQIFDVTDPAAARNLEPAGGRLLTNQIVYGVALWGQAGRVYLAANVGAGAQIYDATSCAAGACSLALVWSGSWAQWGQSPQGADRLYVTFSRSDGKPMLYFGANDQCSGGRQREFLFDASNPAAPVEITPRTTVTVAGRVIDYWSWYYSGNSALGDPTWRPGFSRVAPQRAKFSGNVLYRSAQTIFDAHVWGPAVAPPPVPTPALPPSTPTPTATPTATPLPTPAATPRMPPGCCLNLIGMLECPCGGPPPAPTPSAPPAPTPQPTPLPTPQPTAAPCPSPAPCPTCQTYKRVEIPPALRECLGRLSALPLGTVTWKEQRRDCVRGLAALVTAMGDAAFVPSDNRTSGQLSSTLEECAAP